jgi:hypothetical protein
MIKMVILLRKSNFTKPPIAPGSIAYAKDDVTGLPIPNNGTGIGIQQSWPLATPMTFICFAFEDMGLTGDRDFNDRFLPLPLEPRQFSNKDSIANALTNSRGRGRAKSKWFRLRASQTLFKRIKLTNKTLLF